MMPKQRGVKRFSRRIAGPYVLRAVNTDAEEERAGMKFSDARSYYITRRCIYGGVKNRTQGERVVIIPGRKTFGQMMQALRACYIMEKEINPHANGNEGCYDYQRILRHSTAKANWAMIQRKLEELNADPRPA